MQHCQTNSDIPISLSTLQLITKHGYLLITKLILYSIKTCYMSVPQSKMKTSTEILLWQESSGSACLSVRYRAAVQSLWPPLVGCPPHWMTVSSSPKKGRVDKKMFTCEPFPSVTWSCMFGTRCSRHPCIGPYTWRYISVRTKAVSVSLC